jgi:K+-transporting ATPase ATPase C chain
MHDATTRRSNPGSAVRSAVVILAFTTALTAAYTLAVTALAAAMWPAAPDDLALPPSRAAAFAGPEWFHGRPTAAAGTVSGGSNLGPTNPAFAAAVADRVAAVRAENPGANGPVPVDLVTTSASGFDPHISPASARLQAARVATARGFDERTILELVDSVVERPTFGVLGRPRVNVIRLNAAVAALAMPRTSRSAIPP